MKRLPIPMLVALALLVTSGCNTVTGKMLSAAVDPLNVLPPSERRDVEATISKLKTDTEHRREYGFNPPLKTGDTGGFVRIGKTGEEYVVRRILLRWEFDRFRVLECKRVAADHPDKLIGFIRNSTGTPRAAVCRALRMKFPEVYSGSETDKNIEEQRRRCDEALREIYRVRGRARADSEDWMPDTSGACPDCHDD